MKTSLVKLTVRTLIGNKPTVRYVKRSAIQGLSADDVNGGSVIKLAGEPHHVVVVESVDDVLALMDNAR